MSKKSPSKLPVRKRAPPKHRKADDVVPKSEREELKTLTFNISTLFTIGVFSDVKIEMSEPFKNVNPKDYNRLFAAKCKECSKICDFSIAIKDQASKKNKKELLNHLIEAFENGQINHLLIPKNISNFLNMVVDNIARPFPSMLKITVFDFGDQMLDTAWPHLQLVYKATLKLFSSPITVNLDKHLNFLSCLVSNCCSPDGRERQATKDILIKVFNKCPNTREVIKRYTINQFLTNICTAELLEVYVKIVDTLPKPFSEKEIFIFKNVVLLLHTSPLFLRFCLNLLQVIDHYVKVDPSLLDPTITYIRQHWPVGIVRKQLIFLSELEGLVISYANIMTEKVAGLIFEQLGELVVQPNTEIAQTSIDLITGTSFENLLISFPEAAIQYLIQPLYDSAKKNWNEYVREDATFALQLLSELDKDLFNKQVGKMKEERKKKKVYQQIWKTNWAKVFETAKKKDKSITGANLEVIM